jgi:hypothetical protein
MGENGEGPSLLEIRQLFIQCGEQGVRIYGDVSRSGGFWTSVLAYFPLREWSSEACGLLGVVILGGHLAGSRGLFARGDANELIC